MKTAVAAILGLLALAALPAAGQDLGGALAIRIEPEQFTVGDPARAELILVWEGDQPTGLPQFPAWQGAWGEAEVLEAGPVEAKSDGARKVFRQVLKITAFRPGTLELPPVTAKVPVAGRVVEVESSTPARLLVASVLPGEKSAGGEELEAKGAAGLVGLTLSPWPFWIAVGLLGALNGGAAWRLAVVVGRQRPEAESRKEADTTYAHLSPYEELLQRLDGLDASTPERAHTGVSFALRQFLGRTFEVNALESTTTEIQRLLRAFLPVGLGHELVGLLRENDRIKFAGQAVAGGGAPGGGAPGGDLAGDPATRSPATRARELGRQVMERVPATAAAAKTGAASAIASARPSAAERRS